MKPETQIISDEITEKFTKLIDYAVNIEDTLKLVRNELQKKGKIVLSDESKEKLIKICDDALKNE